MLLKMTGMKTRVIFMLSAVVGLPTNDKDVLNGAESKEYNSVIFFFI
jgi:hypothetical protein